MKKKAEKEWGVTIFLFSSVQVFTSLKSIETKQIEVWKYLDMQQNKKFDLQQLKV